MEFKHIPVLLNECIEGLDIKSNGIYLDGTLGGGGHSLEIAKRIDNGKLYACDRDLEAIEAAKLRLIDYESKVEFIHSNFKEVADKIDGKLDGVLLDLGISSYQIDNADRGFSYMNEASLDMRMDTSRGITAKDVVNKYAYKDLAKIIREYGEDRFASRIASAIISAREERAINTTLELAKIIEESIPPKFRWKRGHPAKKTFQAIRIEVNQELNDLYETVITLARKLENNGRMCVISFHSLEDRIVKNAFKYLELDCICDKSAPICVCDKVKEVKIITHKPIIPTNEELEYNSRANAAKLRIIKKL